MLMIDEAKVKAFCEQRKQSGLRPRNLMDMAKLMNRNPQQIYEIMAKGRVRLDTLGEIAEVLGVGIEEITTDRPEEDEG